MHWKTGIVFGLIAASCHADPAFDIEARWQDLRERYEDAHLSIRYVSGYEFPAGRPDEVSQGRLCVSSEGFYCASADLTMMADAGGPSLVVTAWHVQDGSGWRKVTGGDLAEADASAIPAEAIRQLLRVDNNAQYALGIALPVFGWRKTTFWDSHTPRADQEERHEFIGGKECFAIDAQEVNSSNWARVWIERETGWIRAFDLQGVYAGARVLVLTDSLSKTEGPSPSSEDGENCSCDQ